MQYSYDIVFRAGKHSTAPDTLSRVHCSSMLRSTLHDIHSSLCHPGVAKMFHYVRIKNLPYTLDEVRKMISSCRVCTEVKPRFHKPAETHLIKATQRMERLSIDFKGPSPSASKNKYFLSIVDEYSRFPFTLPCSNMETQTVIACLSRVFMLFGLCACAHSDRGSSFMSRNFVSYMNNLGIATSKCIIRVYNPRGNGQCEKYNDVIWSAIKLSLKTRSLPISQWETVLAEALDSIRSLLCKSTNSTPHERFLKFQRRSALGTSVTSWLNDGAKVLVKRHVRSSKCEPLVDEAEIIHATPSYAHVRLQNGREANVALHDIAPAPGDVSFENDEQVFLCCNLSGGVALIV